MNEGTSPILSYNYGARRPARVRKTMVVMGLMVLGYTAVMWGAIILVPETLIGIFSSDTELLKDAVPALHQYFAAFIFMDLQYIGQTVFKSMNKKKQAIFFSLLRKVVIVVPLTYLMPYALEDVYKRQHATTAGVGALIEKSFQPGREKLEAQGVHVYSLARISRLGKGVIEFVQE